jgi:hypothetical protein
MAITGRILRVSATLGLLLGAAPLLAQPVFAEDAPAATGSDSSFTPTTRPTHSVPKASKLISVQHRIKKPKPAPTVHS